MSGCCSEKQADEKATLSRVTKNRRCTDVVWLLIFIVFVVGMGCIAAFSFLYGDPLRLMYGYDSYGNTCDEENERIPNVSMSGVNLKGKPYLFFMNAKNPSRSLAICVVQCPDQELRYEEDVEKFALNSGSQLCRYDIPIEEYKKINVLSYDEHGKGPCPVLPVPSSYPLLNRCVPESRKILPSAVIRYINSHTQMFSKVLGDLYNSWREMLGLIFVAFGFSLVMVLLIRFLASVIVWEILALASLSTIGGTGLLWWTYCTFHERVQDEVVILDVDLYSEKAFLIYSIIATVLTGILLLIIFVMRKRILYVISLFHEVGNCLAAVPCLLIQPLLTFLVLFFFLIYWMVVQAYLSTADYPSVNSQDGYVIYEDQVWVSSMWWYHLVSLIWVCEFIIACQQYVISETVAKWYFARERNEMNCAITQSMGHLIGSHLGSVICGSFLITLVKIPRLVLMYIDKKLRDRESCCAGCFATCCSCCLWCLEKCLKYLNANAYTVTAIRGTDFCSSARWAFKTLVNNVLQVAAINSIGAFILFLAKKKKVPTATLR